MVEWSKKTLLLTGGIGLTTLGLIIYYVLGAKKPLGKYVVYITATEGGTTTPLPGTYSYDVPTEITVTAFPDAGYNFHGWRLNGELVSMELTFTFTTLGVDHLGADFRKTDGPVLVPAYITPIQQYCTVEDWWKVWWTTEFATYTLHIGPSFNKSGFVKFKICDRYGVGVPDMQIALYSEPMPDIYDFGYVHLNGLIHTDISPLILTSDGDGIVAPKVDYEWIEPNSNYKETIGRGGKITYYKYVIVWYPVDVYPIHDGHYINKPAYYSKFTRKLNPIFAPLTHPIHAYWLDNPDLANYGDAFATCSVKIEDKLYEE